MNKEKILITGAAGQLGSVLIHSLAEIYKEQQLIVSDIKAFDTPYTFYALDVADEKAVEEVVEKEGVDQIYHLAALLSATGEKNPLLTRAVNSQGLINILEAARKHEVSKVFFPSSIAVFGEGANPEKASQFEPLIPSTVYGITKVDGELWANYYWQKYQLDVRSLRYPGIIGHQSMPGGGTTDYAVDIFYAAIKGEKFECFLKEDARLPMIYMDDAIRATLELMEAPAEQLNIRTSYNLQGLSFTPQEIYEEIKKHIPGFEISYQPDFRQKIAESWPGEIDDQHARKDWKWEEDYDLAAMTEDMIKNLKLKIQSYV